MREILINGRRTRVAPSVTRRVREGKVFHIKREEVAIHYLGSFIPPEAKKANSVDDFISLLEDLRIDATLEDRTEITSTLKLLRENVVYESKTGYYVVV